MRNELCGDYHQKRNRKYWMQHDLFSISNFKKFLKGINALKFTNLLYIIEFDMINFFPIPNFKKIEEHLIFGSNLDLMEQTY